MNEEEKKAIKNMDRFANGIDMSIVSASQMQTILNLIEKLKKENEELKEKENKIYKEVQESLSFEKFLIVKERKPDLFNQGRFYISQIIYDILNDVQNPEGIHKENKCIQYIDYIPIQKVKDKIEELDKRIDFLNTELTKCYIEREKLGTETDIDNNETYIFYMEEEKNFREKQEEVLQELLREE